MSTSPTAPAVEPSPTLRWWPGLLLLLGMISGPIVRMLMPDASIGLMMFSFLGPVTFGALGVLWWCFASRAGAGEKLIGLLGLIVIAVAAFFLADPTLPGMLLLTHVGPVGLMAFLVGLVFFAAMPRTRVPVALLLSLLGFGVWTLVRVEGVRGDFEADLIWRWEELPEEEYLAELKKHQSGAPVDASETITLADADWPEFRGPNRDGVVENLTLQTDWETDSPKQLWYRKIGPGWSSFSVARGRLFTQEQRNDEEAVLCLDAETGEILWDYTYKSRFWEQIGGPGPRATPTIADEGLFALGAEGVLVCLDAVTGEEKWTRDLKTAADREPPQWGFSSSPLVVNGLVIVHGGGKEDRGLFAFDATTGDIVWTAPSGDHTYSSPQLATFGDVTGVLMLSNLELRFVSLEDGSTIWEHEYFATNYRVLQPLVLGDTVYIATSLGNGVRRLTVTQSGDDWKVTEEWTTLDMKPDFNDVVYHDGYLYGFDRNIFACLNVETGNREWKRGRYGNGQVLLLSESGQLLIMSEKGEIILANANPEKLDAVAKLKAIEGKSWSHPVLVGDRLYLRNAQHIACYRMPIVGELPDDSEVE